MYVSWRTVEVSGTYCEVSCTYRDVLWRYRVRILTYLIFIVEVSCTYRDMSRTDCGHIVYYRVHVTYRVRIVKYHDMSCTHRVRIQTIVHV